MTESFTTSGIREESRPEEHGETGEEGRNEPSVKTCPECRGRIVHNEAQAELHCRDCGRVIESDQIDHGPEWRAYGSREKKAKSRVGSTQTQLLHDRGLSTVIDWRNKDTYGQSLSSRQQKKMRRLRKWDERFRTKNSQERNLKHALGEINRMASALGCPDPIRETTSVLYRQALEKDLIRGRSIEGVATAALYAGSRMENTPRSFDEVAAVSHVDKLEIERAYRYLVDELELEMTPPNPEAYIARFASQLGCPDETERRSRELIRSAIEAGVHNGRNPIGIAAAALYAAAKRTNQEVTQGDLAEIANVSKPTIAKRYPEILQAADEVSNG
ncbi:transcription initiation factor IIB [Salinibaculum salinum]|uniref:transcription initiation factor IIB n=1 Tax=Salinibaculum salinum TaxID=3131996 RepID=UPI0030EF1ACD